MNTIPTEILTEIILKINDYDQVRSCSKVCKLWLEIVSSKIITGRCLNFSDFILNSKMHFYPKYVNKNITDHEKIIMFNACKLNPKNKLTKLFMVGDIRQDKILLWAIKKNYFMLVKYLVGLIFDSDNNNNNDNAEDYYIQILTESCQTNNLEMVKYIISKYIHKYTKDDYTRILSNLMDSDLKLHMKIVKYLISLGANINGPDEYDLCPLNMAIRDNNYHLVKYLVDMGAYINGNYYVDDDSIDLAVWKNNIHIVKYLIANGGKFDKNNPRLLILAIKNNNSSMIKYLLSLGIDINSIDFDDKMCLSEAIKSNNYQMIKFLIRVGAYVN